MDKNHDLKHYCSSFFERLSPLEAAVLIVLMFVLVGMMDAWLCGTPCR